MTSKKNKETEADTAETKKKNQTEPASEERENAESAGHVQKNDKNRFWSVVLFAIGVLIFLMAVIEGTAGWRAVHNFLLGVFGLAVFFVPAILIYTAVLIGLEKSQKCVSGRAIWGVGLMFLTSSAIQIFGVGKLPGDGFISNIVRLYNDGKELDGGGVASFLVAGPLLSIFGSTGAKIITVIMFFVFIMLLSGMGIIQFFDIISRPFRFIGRCFIGIKNMITGGDFEDAFDDTDDDDDDDEEKRDFEADLEAINIVNNREPERERATHGESDGTEPEFLFDVPLPADKDTDTGAEAQQSQPKNEEPVDSSLDILVTRAADSAERKKEQNAREAAVSGEDKERSETQYIIPPVDLLTPPDVRSNDESASEEMHEKAETIVNTLKSFGVTVRISNICRGPAITRYEIQPGSGVSVKKIKALENDLALYLAAQIRIEAPVPGKSAVGIEVPNVNKDTVTLREVLSSQQFRSAKSKLSFAVGKDIAGNIIVGDVAQMPHMIIAGTTGSGKSVCTRSIIMSILYNATPDEVKLILIDPKIVEFKVFDGIPHLLIPIVTDPKKAAGALNWAVNEMMRRYQMFAEDGVTDLKSYNEKAGRNPGMNRIPQIVIFIDELADMMLVAGKEVEDFICRLAQMGRAAGMHLVVATQRPTTDVITGLIKANIPSRIALSVMSQVDSRTIIDMNGAEKLLGNGDMLYKPIGVMNPVRIQGCFASSKDIGDTLAFIRSQAQSSYDSEIMEEVDRLVPAEKNDKDSNYNQSFASGSDEEYVERAITIAVENGQLSTSMLQRKLGIGFARAGRIMDNLEEMGVIGPNEGAKPRRVLMSKMQYDERRARMGE